MANNERTSVKPSRHRVALSAAVGAVAAVAFLLFGRGSAPALDPVGNWSAAGETLEILQDGRIGAATVAESFCVGSQTEFGTPRPYAGTWKLAHRNDSEPGMYVTLDGYFGLGKPCTTYLEFVEKDGEFVLSPTADRPVRIPFRRVSG
ncbi:hypothetical protein [Kitasatospora sp. NPDC057223]|uniref:hypothetical protein n=1 Tax=Kitasatospora sp. NPDC057223 TaxID=3346055 RepID=UPI00362808D3